MRILAKVRDYYDHVEFIYSPEGGDPANTYVRKGIDCGTVTVQGAIPSFPHPEGWSMKAKAAIYNGWVDFPWRFKWCSICGELYLLVADCPLPAPRDGHEYHVPDSSFKVISEGHPALKNVVSRNYEILKKGGKIAINDVIGVPNQCAVEISKMIGEPCFLIERFSERSRSYGRNNKRLIISYEVRVCPDVPNLGKLGFGSLVPAEQMYQRISMFMGIIKDCPDNNPPAEVSDKDRLVQKGFDLKVSFRGKPV